MSKNELQKVSEETMRFMRGNYVLDEIPGKYYDIDCLKFRQGKRTILSINIHPDHYDFQIIFGKVEREKFEAQFDEFPKFIQEMYISKKPGTLADGLWLLFRVEDLITLEGIKQLILIKKKPNRKPFPKNNIHMANCGHRCDLCIHYKGKTSFTAEEVEFRKKCHIKLYDVEEWPLNCDGCHFPNCNVESTDCRKAKGADKCWACENFKTCLKTAGFPPYIHHQTITADEVTWAILPYVKGQYGN